MTRRLRRLWIWLTDSHRQQLDPRWYDVFLPHILRCPVRPGRDPSLPAPDPSRGVSDPLYPDAHRLVLAGEALSAYALQRQLEIGYLRALSLLEALEHEEVVRFASDGCRRVVAGSRASDAANPAEPPPQP